MLLSVAGPRPVALAADALEQRFQQAVTYEDPRDADPGKWTRGPGRAVAPRSGAIEIRYPSDLDLRSVLRLVLDAHQEAGGVGRFKTIESDDRFDVVPTVGVDSSGRTLKRDAILDTRVWIPRRERDGIGLLEALAASISTTRGEMIQVGVVPTNLLTQLRGVQGGIAIPARNVLGALLRPLPTQHSWRLSHDPSSDAFVLNVHAIRP